MKIDKVKITIEKDTQSPNSLGWAMDIQMAIEQDDGKGLYRQNCFIGATFVELLSDIPRHISELFNA